MPFDHGTSDAMTARLVRFDEIEPAEVEQWNSICDSRPEFQSALLRPEFAETLSRCRDDVRVALFEKDGRLMGVLACHLRPDGLARPLGAPFADYSGPVMMAGVQADLKHLVRIAGIPAYSSAAMVVPVSEGKQVAPTDSHLVRPGDLSPHEFLESRRELHAKRFKNFRRLAKQVERDVGEMRLEWGPVSNDVYRAILDLKSRQYRTSGLVDLTSTTASRRILDTVASGPYGFAIVLKCGEQMVSAHFGIKVGSEYHPWIAVYDSKFSAYSPGNLLIIKALSQFPEMGITSYDLATGHDHYKKYFANATRTTEPVFVTGDGLRAARHQISNAAWTYLGASRENTGSGRLKRRFDQIATSEFSAIRRIREFCYAVLARTVIRRRKQPLNR